MMRNLVLKTMLMLAPLWLSGGAIGQVEPEAAELLQRAQQVHGGHALLDMTSYREEGSVTLFGPAGEPVAQLRGVTLLDLESASYRDELYSGDELMTISQVTPAGAWTWTPNTGLLRAPDSQAEILRSGLYRGLFGLRFGSEREAADSLGLQTWGSREGTAVRLTTQDVDTIYLLDEDGRMLAQRYASPQLGEVTVFYTDYRQRDDVLVPFTVEYEAAGQAFLKTDLDTIEPNLDLPAEAFEPPGDAEF